MSRSRTQTRRHPPSKAARSAPSTGWVIVGAVILVVVAGLIIAAALTGSTGPQTAEVSITGTALPTYPGTADDPAVGMQVPEISGTSFDDTPVAIGDDGHPKVILLLAHW